MKAYVAVATKGRPVEVTRLLDHLKAQTFPATKIVIAGASSEDIGLAQGSALAKEGKVEAFVADTVGAAAQRNRAIEKIISDAGGSEFFAAFFDDDFCPATDWLSQCRSYFQARADISCLTGRVLADGVRGAGYSYDDAAAYLSGARSPEPHWASGDEVRDVKALYGCNMAARDVALRTCRFDEALPLYSWQEDRDFAGQARRFGRTVYAPACRGVHLGVKGARTSGKRFGYSQIANPLYLARKGTVAPDIAGKFMLRALAANLIRSPNKHPLFDYRGRLQGNMRAIFDLMRGRCAPGRILDFE